MKRKTYQAWTKQATGGQEVMTECMAVSTADFHRIIKQNKSIVTSRIKAKK